MHYLDLKVQLDIAQGKQIKSCTESGGRFLSNRQPSCLWLVQRNWRLHKLQVVVYISLSDINYS